MIVVSGVGSCVGGVSETVLCVLWIDQVGRSMRSTRNWGFHCGEGDTTGLRKMSKNSVMLGMNSTCHTKLRGKVFLTPLLCPAFPDCSVGKSAYNTGDLASISGWGRFLWRRKWQPTPVFLPGKSHE